MKREAETSIEELQTLVGGKKEETDDKKTENI